jgi:hypothetical protein
MQQFCDQLTKLGTDTEEFTVTSWPSPRLPIDMTMGMSDESLARDIRQKAGHYEILVRGKSMACV